ncbi:hypothetical protein D3C71_1529550 [compost metagenome]
MSSLKWNIRTSLLPLRSIRYSVWPGNLKVSDWMLCLLIGAVTNASISPFIKSSVAFSKESKAYFPPVSLAIPSSIFTSSSQQLMIFAFLGLARDGSVMTLKLKSLRPKALRWYEATLVCP